MLFKSASSSGPDDVESELDDFEDKLIFCLLFLAHREIIITINRIIYFFRLDHVQSSLVRRRNPVAIFV